MRRAITTAVALLLLTTAALKVYGLSATSPVNSSLWSDGRVRLATILWEMTLGLWLLSGVRPTAAWLAAVSTFLGFAAVSATLGVSGAPSCGCLGAVKANPWWMFGVDVAVLALLLYRRPALADLWGVRDVRWGQSVLLPASCAAALFLVAGGVALARHGSVEAAVAHARDELVVARHQAFDFGAAPPNTVHEGVVEIVNYSVRPVRVFGGSTGCGYDMLADCPADIPAGGVVPLRVRVIVPARPGEYRFAATFWVSGYTDSTHPISVVLSGRSTGE